MDPKNSGEYLLRMQEKNLTLPRDADIFAVGNQHLVLDWSTPCIGERYRDSGFDFETKKEKDKQCIAALRARLLH
jgi:hypothetical protein